MTKRLVEKLPSSAQRLIRHVRHPVWLGSVGGIRPVSSDWGFDRGLPIDRYYIEAFLASRGADIRGRVLEVKDSEYTTRFGTGVERADVLDLDASNPRATVIADLAAADAVPSASFDCFILTQTIQIIYDTRAVLRHAHRVLRPGGVLLATVPVVSRIVPDEQLTDYWRFTKPSCERLFGEAFEGGEVEVRTYGNVLAGVAFLAGLAVEDVPRRKLDMHDPHFPILVAIRAVRAAH